MNEIRKKVLVVDDDPSLRTLASAVLEDEYDVREAEDGVAAWETAQAWRPDLVVTDIMMPRMHGYELCVRLKGLKGIAGVRIIVASSKPFATDRSQASVAGADEYIVKPYSPEELLEKARRLLSGCAECRPEKQTEPDTPHSVPSSVRSVRPVCNGDLPVYVRFWGTRGSCPTGGVKTARYGGNTACTEVRIGEVPVIIDCGTGLRELGVALAAEFPGKPIEGHIFVGHTHWDHIQGFPFFIPFYNPRNKFNVHSVRGAHGSLRDIFSDSMALDYFPIPLSNLAAKLKFVELQGPVDMGVARVSFHHLNHPGVCIGFKVEAQGRKIVYLSDHEQFRRLSGENEMSCYQDAAVADFARGSDLLIMEAQYTEEEYAFRKGWGHSTYDDVVKFGMDTGAKRLAIFHHDPAHTDDILDRHLEYCKSVAGLAGSSMECFAASEGMCLEL